MELWKDHKKFEDKASQLIFIGNGAAFFINAFAEEFQITSPIVTDPSLKVFELAGMNRGVTKVFSLKSAANALKMALKGHRQTAIQGDALQMGGVVVVNSQGEIVFSHSNSKIGDYPSNDYLLSKV